MRRWPNERCSDAGIRASTPPACHCSPRATAALKRHVRAFEVAVTAELRHASTLPNDRRSCGRIALLAAARDPRVGCVGALDFVNTGARGRRLLSDRAADSARTVYDSSLAAPGGPYRAEGGGAALVAEVKANAERWDVLAHAPALRERRVLLVGSANRTEHDSLVTALGGPHAPHHTAHWWPTDHSFSDRRIALARAIVDWVRGPCGL